MGRVDRARYGLALVDPTGPVIVGADILIQATLGVLATETEATSAATERVLPDTAVEGWVPLAHHIKVTPAFLRGWGWL